MKTICLIFFLFCELLLLAQTKEIEEYRLKIKSETKDSSRIKMYNYLAWKLLDAGLNDQALEINRQAFRTFDALPIEQRSVRNIKITEAYSHMMKGMIHRHLNQYPEALHHYTVSLNRMERLDNEDGVRRVIVNIATAYSDLGKYPEALNYQLRSLEKLRQRNDSVNMPSTLLSIGTTFMYTGKNEKALFYYKEALEIARRNKDSVQISFSLVNVGNIQQLTGELQSALTSYKEGAHIDSLIGNENSLAANLLNAGLLYLNMKDFDKAELFFEKAKNLYVKLNNHIEIATVYINLSRIQYFKKNFKECKSLLNQGLQFAEITKMPEAQKNIYEQLSSVDSAMGDFKGAYYNYRKLTDLQSKIISESKMNEITKRELNFDFQVKEEAAKAEQQKKDLIANEEKRREAVIRNAFIGGFILLLFLAVVVYRGYLNKKKANKVISKQHEEVQKQKEMLEAKNAIIEEKQQEIIDSLNYAKRIQTSLLPTDKYLKRIFKKYS